jgi:replicative DNA helicase
VNDRTPPQDIPAEQGALGGMLLSRDAIADVAEILGGSEFYEHRHETIFLAILHLYADGRPADAVTVAAELQRRGELSRIGGAPYLHTLACSVPAPANAGYYAQAVRETSLRRRMVTAGTRITQMGYAADGSDVADLVDRAQAETHALSGRRDDEAERSNLDEIDALLEEIESGVETGLMTGFSDLDQLTRGLRNGQMIIVAARPAIGKSTLGLDICRHVSITGRLTSAIFSLEMSRAEIILRTLSAEAQIPQHHLAPGRLSDREWAMVARHRAHIATAPLIIDDSPHLTMMGIRTKARRLAQRHDLRLIVVDYLQLMSSGTTRRGENRQVEVSEMSRALKLLAKELQIPVIAVAQLNRGPEQRADKRPLMSDLRESGSLEQDADVVILLHREDAHDPDTPRKGEADLIVAKHRNGPTATITVAFEGDLSRFVDMAKPSWTPTTVLEAHR